MARRKGRSQGPRKQEQEKSRLKEAANFYLDQCVGKPPQDRLSLLGVAKKFDVKYCTLRNRVTGKHKDAKEAHESQQSLSHVQEKVLVEWLHQLSNECEPVSKWGIRKKVETITGGRVKPGKAWVRRFLKRHPTLKLGKPSGLDPKDLMYHISYYSCTCPYI
jgi:hypothetical protein